MRVLVDASYAARGPSGTQVYIDGLLGALSALGVRADAVAGRAGRHLDPLAEARWQARLARWARGADVLHHALPARAPTRTPQVVMVHDLAFVALPGCFDARFAAVAARTHRAAARRAAAVVCPSQATADELWAHWGVRALVAPHGPGQAPAADRGQARWFLYVGDAEPRKNLPRLLAAYRRYRDENGPAPTAPGWRRSTAPDAVNLRHPEAGEPLELVIAGSAARHVDPAPGLVLDPAPDLTARHRHAAALILPSLHEGFGLPALEAMHAGTPVLAADIPALRELCAGAARYADPRDTAAITRHLTELATVAPLREELRRRGRARATAFSWEASGRAHLAAFRLASGAG